MEPPASPPSSLLLADSCLAFAPVPQQRHRADGWTPETQARFIRALEAMGSVGKGGAIDVGGGPDMAVVHAALRDETVPPHAAKATKETI